MADRNFRHHTESLLLFRIREFIIQICIRQLKRHWKRLNFLKNYILEHSVLERIWIKGSYLSQWLPQGESGPPKVSKSRWIEISDHSEIFFFALKYIKNWTKDVPWKKKKILKKKFY